MVETYKKIEGFENYSVSDFGNVRNNKTGRILKENIMPNGYLHMGLRKDKKTIFSLCPQASCSSVFTKFRTQA